MSGRTDRKRQVALENLRRIFVEYSKVLIPRTCSEVFSSSVFSFFFFILPTLPTFDLESFPTPPTGVYEGRRPFFLRMLPHGKEEN